MLDIAGRFDDQFRWCSVVVEEAFELQRFWDFLKKSKRGGATYIYRMRNGAGVTEARKAQQSTQDEEWRLDQKKSSRVE